MTSNLLYFPYINLPQTEWTFRTLLYYDSISSIVPDDYFHNPENKFDKFTLELLREDLVIMVNPLQALERPFELTQPFMDFITSPYFKIDVRISRFKGGFYERINNTKLSPTLVSSLKFNYEIMYQLQELGLAKHAYDNFYHVEKSTATYLMSYLANILAIKLELMPITNLAMNKWHMRYNNRILDPDIAHRRNRVLENVIPMPSDINLSKLLDFKEKHHKSLGLFKAVVEQIALDPRYNDDLLLDQKIEELNYHKNEITASMNSSRFGKIVFGTLSGLVGTGIAMSTTDNSLSAMVLSSFGFANAIHSALSIESPNDIKDTTGMKYLSLVDKYLR
ncbi:kinase [Pedobacter sp. LMG 31464]|uniref:Kinase n=1 Tax=Pedobacter planticolens TaxID=2679964 RepID=A0A923DZ53_9SPHI|nr:kinase [Pedobacter planticolens]MBB2144577.1 kinase [Pedobacter planticolens]